MPSTNEFSIIEHYFQAKSQAISRTDVLRGIGDDCAIVEPQPGKRLVFSMDTLIEGVHFPQQTAPHLIASKALAANISDLAAMGAEPAWFTLALSLPEVEEEWLEAFSTALFELADRFRIQLLGGDTTRSPTLSITIQVHGYVPEQALLREGARVGDLIGVTGKLGAAALGLQLELATQEYPLSPAQREQALAALHSPEPQIAAGQLLLTYGCRCAIDISDGLCADLGHILTQSGCGGIIHVEKLPLADCLTPLPQDKALKMALTGGDDYQLCFTLAQADYQRLKEEQNLSELSIIGEIVTGEGLQLMQNNQTYHGLNTTTKGYNHFG